MCAARVRPPTFTSALPRSSITVWLFVQFVTVCPVNFVFVFFEIPVRAELCPHSLMRGATARVACACLVGLIGVAGEGACGASSQRDAARGGGCRAAARSVAPLEALRGGGRTEHSAGRT